MTHSQIFILIEAYSRLYPGAILPNAQQVVHALEGPYAEGRYTKDRIGKLETIRDYMIDVANDFFTLLLKTHDMAEAAKGVA